MSFRSEISHKNPEMPNSEISNFKRESPDKSVAPSMEALRAGLKDFVAKNPDKIPPIRSSETIHLEDGTSIKIPSEHVPIEDKGNLPELGEVKFPSRESDIKPDDPTEPYVVYATNSEQRSDLKDSPNGTDNAEGKGLTQEQKDLIITDNGEHTLTKDVSEVKSPIQNKLDGLAREKEVAQELREQYPPEEGYKIIPEAYLRDKDGNIVRDPVTGEARRIDFVVEKDGKIVDSVEVTSKTADKTDQMAKENRIRENGGNYVRNSDGELVKIPSDVHTRIERRD